jgi:hypothetical protein
MNADRTGRYKGVYKSVRNQGVRNQGVRNQCGFGRRCGWIPLAGGRSDEGREC